MIHPRVQPVVATYLYASFGFLCLSALFATFMGSTRYAGWSAFGFMACVAVVFVLVLFED